MAVYRIPPVDAPPEKRIVPNEVWFEIWYVPEFPLHMIGGKLDKLTADGQTKDDFMPRNALLGLKNDIEKSGKLRNPVIIWNHHPLRGTKQPYWLVRAGSNRTWCADQLGWKTIPAIVTTAPGEFPSHKWHGVRVRPEDLQSYFPDGGIMWANKEGIGLQLAKKPQETYAAYEPSAAEIASIKPTDHGRIKIINPLLPETPS